MKRPLEGARAVGERAERAGRSPPRADLARVWPPAQGRGQHLVEPDHRRRQPRLRLTCGSTGSRPISSIWRTGSARFTIARSRAAGRPRPGTPTTRWTRWFGKSLASVKQERAGAALRGGLRKSWPICVDVWVYNSVQLRVLGKTKLGSRAAASHRERPGAQELGWLRLHAS